MKHVHIPTVEELLQPDSITRLPNGNYKFINIQYQGGILEKVEFSPKYLLKGARKTQEKWNNFSHRNKKGWSAVDAEILYQCLLRAYEIRSDKKHKETVQALRKDMHKIFSEEKDCITTLTEAAFGYDLDAVIRSHGPGKQETPVTIPEFNGLTTHWSYLVLAETQPEKKLGKTNFLTVNARPLMKALLGKDYELAGAVFQYFSTLKDGNLREAMIWTPSEDNRIRNWAVEFGILEDKFILAVGLSIGSKYQTLGVR